MLVNLIKKVVVFPLRSFKYEVARFGDDEAGWSFHGEYLGRDSTIISGGVGQNISFELDLINHYGSVVHIFDPSPTGLSTLKNLSYQKELKNLIFNESALSGSTGKIYLSAPSNCEEGSWVSNFQNNNEDGILVDSISLSSYMKKKRLGRIDLLKIDIEGAEYGVIDDILKEGLEVAQICLEFHCNKQIDISYTYYDIYRYLLKLYIKGYRVIHLTKSDFTLISSKYLLE